MKVAYLNNKLIEASKKPVQTAKIESAIIKKVDFGNYYRSYDNDSKLKVLKSDVTEDVTPAVLVSLIQYKSRQIKLF